MEITGELFIDVPMFRRMAKAEFDRAECVSTLSWTSLVLAVNLALIDAPALGTLALILGILVILTVPFGPVRKLTRMYRREGPIVWRYQINQHGFRITGRRVVEGSWARYTKVVDAGDLWLVRPPFKSHRVALPKAAFSEADRAVVEALIRRRLPATVPA